LRATTLNVYAVPLERPSTTADVWSPATVWVIEPGVEVTTYSVIAVPPFAGAVQDTVAFASPAVACTAVGLLGAVDTVTFTIGSCAGGMNRPDSEFVSTSSKSATLSCHSPAGPPFGMVKVVSHVPSFAVPETRVACLLLISCPVST
jgi:hypothetical protein